MLDDSRDLAADARLAAWAAEIPRVLGGLSSVLQRGRLTEAVLHKSRRELKRLGSLLRLAPPSATTLADDTRELTSELRRKLGAGRDAAVMIETLHSLAADLGETAARIEPILSAHHRAVSGRLDRGSRRADQGRMARLGAAWLKQPPKGSAADMRAAAVETYRRARKRAGRLGRGKEAALHPLRKAAVDHQNHLEFLLGEDEARLRQVRRLRDRLGRCHDLEVLRDFVRSRADVGAEDLVRLEHVLAAHRHRLAKKAARLAGRLFRERPRAFAKSLRKAMASPPSPPPRAERRPANAGLDSPAAAAR